MILSVRGEDKGWGLLSGDIRRDQARARASCHLLHSCDFAHAMMRGGR